MVIGVGEIIWRKVWGSIFRKEIIPRRLLMVVVIQKADIRYVEICTNRCKE